MRGWFIGLLGLPLFAVAEEEAGAKKPFDVADVISASVEKLGPPKWRPEIVSWRPAIDAGTKTVQEHVQQGIALIHAGWDFEAYRHFCEAAKEDPECLMAFWGIAFSLVQPDAEINEERSAALDRMFDLADRGLGSEVERAHAGTLAWLFSDQREAAPDAFAQAAKQFPNDLQMQLIAAFLKKDGYDQMLGDGPGQKEAMGAVAKLRENHPGDKMVDLFWVTLQEGHPDGPSHIRGEVLPVMRKLAASAPQFPPYRHMQGHFEWRAGNLRQAQKEFSKATELYAAYMKEEGIAVADCPNWVRSKLYEATARFSLGEFDEALAIANELGKMSFPEERIESPGIAALLWEGRTLAARLYLARGTKDDYKKGLDALPGKEEGQKLANTSSAVIAWEGWRNTLAAANAIEKQVMDRADIYLQGIEGSNEMLGTVGGGMISRSGRNYWARARQGLGTTWQFAQGLNARSQKGTDRSRAGFWFEMASDRDMLASGFMPPILLLPMELPLAEWHAAEGNRELADEHYKGAMSRQPNDVQILASYADWLDRTDRQEKAEKLRAHIKTVKS